MTPQVTTPHRDGRVAARIATTGLAVLFLAGLWLITAPFALGDQPRTGPWTTPTRTDLITGGILAALSAVGLLIVTAAAVRELYHRTGQQLPPVPATPENHHVHP
jgi:hypothetical protein